jgi:hypothetical protein
MSYKESFIKFLKKGKHDYKQNMKNSFGWKTNRRLVVIESDDWGSIRVPSRDVYEKLLRMGDRADKDPFTKYDSLASEDDLSLLLEVMTKYKDWRGNYPVITANCAVSNPDFPKIKDSGFRNFYYEPFPKTLERYPKHKLSFKVWQQGMTQNIIFPQLHCREHMNINRWLKDLQEGKRDVLMAFDNNMISTGNSFSPENKYAYMDAFNYDTEEEIERLKIIVKEGAEIFKEIFGFPTKSIISPCYIWGSELEEEFANNKIEYIQGGRYQHIPQKCEGTKKMSRKTHFIGQVNDYNQIYLLRNCDFEPSWDVNVDWVDRCLRDISIAFKWNKPATISTHRLNYIGYINDKNRDNNLKLLSRLFSGIVNTWPDVEFITSVELGDIIRNDLKVGTS